MNDGEVGSFARGKVDNQSNRQAQDKEGYKNRNKEVMAAGLAKSGMRHVNGRDFGRSVRC